MKKAKKLYISYQRARNCISYQRARNCISLIREQENWLQALINNKKQNYISNKLRENIAKPKELWKSLSQLGLPSKYKNFKNMFTKK